MRYQLSLSLVILSFLIACTAMTTGCTGAKKDIEKAFEISDDLGKERQTKVLGRDVIIHPEADKKITIPF